MSDQGHNGPDSGPGFPGAGRPGADGQPDSAFPPPPAYPYPPSGAQQQPPANPYQANPWEQPNPWGQQNPWAQQNPWGQAYPAPAGGPLPPAGYAPPPKPGIIPLRPLGLGEILDGAFRACRRSPGATFGSALLIQAVIAVVAVVLGFVFSGSFVEPTPAMSDSEALSSAVGILSLVGWLTLGTVAGGLLIQGILVISTARAVLDLKSGFGQTWRILRPGLLRLTGLVVLMVAAPAVAITLLVLLFAALIALLDGAGIVIVVLASLASLAAMVWVSVKLAVTPAVIILEGTGVFRSIARAWQVTRANWWRVFGILALTGLIVSVLLQVLSIPFSLIVNLSVIQSPDAAVAVIGPVIAAAGSLLVAGVAYAFQSAVTSLVYVDLRMRREGFDVALMREQENPGIKAPDFLPGRNAPAMPGGPYAGSGNP